VLRRLIALALAVHLVLVPGYAAAKPQPKGSPDAEVIDVTRRAEALLDKLEYERAREVLESSVRSLPSYKKAKPTAKAKLLALLGRARAELGDSIGADEAFQQAVAWDRRVKLSSSTSPKILEALERARANAPDAAEVAPIEEPPPEKPEKPKPKPKERPSRDAGIREDAAAADAEPSRDAGVIADASAPADAAVPVDAAELSDAGVIPITEPAVPIEEPPPPPKPKALGPTLRHRVLGQVLAGRTITLVIEHEKLPKGAKLELYIRRAQTSPFKQELLTKTGTTAVRKITMDRPRIELYARAVKAKKVVAQIGTENDPIVISTLPPPPWLVDAWGVKEERPQLMEKVGTASTATAAPAKASTESLVPPPQVEPKDDGGDDVLLWAGIGGGVVLLAGAVVLTVFLLSGEDACDVEDGLGCAEIQILPLVSF
jgi:hypothetical protein